MMYGPAKEDIVMELIILHSITNLITKLTLGLVQEQRAVRSERPGFNE